MGTGRAVIVGVSAPGPGSGWSARPLPGVMNDVRSMTTFFQRQGFHVDRPLVEREATAGAVLAAIRSAAGQLQRGDMFAFCYAGHGAQQRSTDADEPFDQLLLTYDRPIVDDELGRLWPEFRKDVRIVVLTDSCHSGTVVRELRQVETAAGEARQILVERAAGDETPKWLSIGLMKGREGEATRDGRIEGLQGSLLHMAACLDAEKALDLGSNGAFTDALISAWNAGFQASYDQLFDAIRRRIRSRQTPLMTLYGWDQSLFRAQKPFDPTARWPL